MSMLRQRRFSSLSSIFECGGGDVIDAATSLMFALLAFMLEAEQDASCTNTVPFFPVTADEIARQRET